MIGLYIHIPYCKRKCDYCSFYSLPSNSVNDLYIDSIINEISTYQSDVKEKVDTVYIGGGTPSLLTPSQIKKLFKGINNIFELTNAEISVEVNPESVNLDFLLSLKEVGVNRISIGIQSLTDISLKEIGRLHDRKKGIEGIKLCKSVFENVNADYMLGLPFQNITDIEEEITTLSELGITHLSAYSLILEEDTPLYERNISGDCDLPNEDMQCDYYNCVYDTLKKKGFSRYEISNFSYPNYECKHNLNCWRLREYIGIGPSAHSFYKGKRYFNPSDLDSYILSNGILKRVEEGENFLIDREIEFVMLGLRTREGISFFRYKEIFGYDFIEKYKESLSKVARYIDISEEGIRILDDYYYISNYIIGELINSIV